MATLARRATGSGGTLANLSIRRPVGTLSVAALIFILGLFSLDRLAVDLLPEISYPEVRVTVNYPGVAPEVMEQQVTRVLERNLSGVENLVSLQSRASEGRTNVNLIFNYGTNLDLAIQDASRYLEVARPQMPADIEPPRLRRFDPSEMPVFQAGFRSSLRTPVQVRDWLENRLAPQLTSIQGVGAVDVAGGVLREVEVIIDQERLRSYGLSFTDVENALREQNVDIPAGQITSRSFEVMAKTDGRFRSTEEIAAVLLSLPGQDRRIPLSEVAQIRDGHDQQRVFVHLDGAPATQISIAKQPDANTVAVVEGVRQRLAELEQSGFIPDDMQWSATRDPSFFIRGSVQAVATAAVLGGTLAMLVVLLFLGSLRKGFVIGLSIPLAVMATFALMGATGLSLNIMTLGALALGVGLLLDNAIVVLENIGRHRERLGKSAEVAAHDGAREVFSAVLAATLTNLAAVAPFLMVSGLAALLFRELILTLTFAIMASLAVAITVVPMLAALLANVRFESGLNKTLPLRAFAAGIEGLTRGYRWLLGYVVRVPSLIVIVAIGLLVGSTLLARDLGAIFLPPADDGNVTARMMLPPGTPPEETVLAARQIEQVLGEMPHVDSLFSLIGGHLFGGVVNPRNSTASFWVQLSPASDRPGWTADRWVTEARQQLAQVDLPGGRVFVRPPSIRGLRTNLAGVDISVGVVGDELSILDTLARDVVTQLEDIPGLDGVELARDDRSPLLNIDVDRERASALGLKVSEIGRAARIAVNGSVPSRFSTPTADYDIRVRLPRDAITTADDLGDIVVFRPDGAPVYLREVASFSLGEGPAHIERENQIRILRVNGDVDRSVTDLGTVGAEVRARLAAMDLPDGYNFLYGGEEQAIQETNRALALVIALSLLLVFVVLAVQYERLSNPLIILGAAPLALTGALGALWLTSTPLSAPVMLGAVVLVGIVVNNAILLVEYIEIGRREHNMSAADAAIEAGSVRLRPILMTTLTTVAGMLPLAIGMGAGADLMQPLAIAVVGGLTTAMLLTLFVTPCLYLVGSRIAEALTRFVTGRSSTARTGDAADSSHSASS